MCLIIVSISLVYNMWFYVSEFGILIEKYVIKYNVFIMILMIDLKLNIY